MAAGRRVLAQFKSEEGSLIGVPLDLPLDVDEQSLGHLCNTLLENVSGGMRHFKLVMSVLFVFARKSKLLMNSMSMRKKCGGLSQTHWRK